MLDSGIMTQPMLIIPSETVTPFVVHADNPLRNEVGFLRHPAVTVILIKIVSVTCYTVS